MMMLIIIKIIIRAERVQERFYRSNDLLYIDLAVIKEVKSRNKDLAIDWIDYKKAYDMVPHS